MLPLVLPLVRDTGRYGSVARTVLLYHRSTTGTTSRYLRPSSHETQRTPSTTSSSDTLGSRYLAGCTPPSAVHTTTSAHTQNPACPTVEPMLPPIQNNLNLPIVRPLGPLLRHK